MTSIGMPDGWRTKTGHAESRPGATGSASSPLGTGLGIERAEWELYTAERSRSSMPNVSTLPSATAANPPASPNQCSAAPAQRGPTHSASKSMLAMVALTAASSTWSPSAHSVGTQSLLTATSEMSAPTASITPQNMIALMSPQTMAGVAPPCWARSRRPKTAMAPQTPTACNAIPRRTTRMRSFWSIHCPAAGPKRNLRPNTTSPKMVGAKRPPSGER